MPKSPLLSAAVENYIEVRRHHLATATALNDASVLRRMARHIGPVPVHALQPAQLESFFYGRDGLQRGRPALSGLGARGMQASTLNKARSRVKGFLEFCRSRRWVDQDLLVNVRPLPVTRRKRLQLSAGELLALLDAAEDPRDRMMIALAVNTGLRAREIVTMRVGHLRLDRHELYVWISKTKEEDIMPVTADLAVEARRWLTAYSSELTVPLADDMLLCPARGRQTWDHSSGERVSVRGHLSPYRAMEKNPAQVVKRALAGIGYPDTTHEGFHTIRRSIGRIYFDQQSAAGYDGALRQTSALLHHANAATTELYLGLSVERAKRDESMQGRPFLTTLIPHSPAYDLTSRRAHR